MRFSKAIILYIDSFVIDLFNKEDRIKTIIFFIIALTFVLLLMFYMGHKEGMANFDKNCCSCLKKYRNDIYLIKDKPLLRGKLSFDGHQQMELFHYGLCCKCNTLKNKMGYFK